MAKYWEIVQLSDGAFVLQSPEHQDEQPLVRIEFSAEAERLLEDQIAQVAQAMIGAGVQAASFLSDRPFEAEAESENEPSEQTSLH
jgi:hypothetical protein|tara:strand:- start:2139 stop:2396 length:258 start_codon:yes stop_codon:yes gene_type:complete